MAADGARGDGGSASEADSPRSVAPASRLPPLRGSITEGQGNPAHVLSDDGGEPAKAESPVGGADNGGGQSESHHHSAAAEGVAHAAGKERWTVVRTTLKEKGVDALRSRRGDTLAGAGRRLLVLSVALAAYIAFGGAVFSAIEREGELATLEEYSRWEGMVSTLAEKKVLVGRFESLAKEMLTASNPDPAVRSERQRQQAAAVASGNVVVAASLAPPSLALSPASAGVLAYVEDGAAVAPLAGVALTADTLAMRNASVRIASGYDGEGDQLRVDWTLPPLNEAESASAVIQATFNADLAQLNLVASGAALVGTAQLEAALRRVVFETSSDTPIEGERVVHVVAVDTQLAASQTAVVTLSLEANNDVPTLSFVPTTLAHEVTDAALVLMPDVDADDPDNALCVEAVVWLSSGSGRVGDVLSVSGVHVGFTVFWDAASYALTITGDAPRELDAWEGVLAAVEFSTTTTDNSEEREISMTLEDADGGVSAAVTRDVTLTRNCGAPCAVGEFDAAPCGVGAARACSDCTVCDSLGAVALQACAATSDATCAVAEPLIFWDSLTPEGDPVDVFVATTTIGATLVIGVDEPVSCDDQDPLVGREELVPGVPVGSTIYVVACAAPHTASASDAVIVVQPTPPSPPAVFEFIVQGMRPEDVTPGDIAGIKLSISSLTGVPVGHIFVTVLADASASRLRARRLQVGTLRVAVSILVDDGDEQAAVLSTLDASIGDGSLGNALVAQGVTSNANDVGSACAAGEFFVAGSCVACDGSCATCRGATAADCKSCADGAYLLVGEAGTTGSCQPCDDACLTCTGGTSADCGTSCATGYYHDGDACNAVMTCAHDEYETQGPTSTSDRQCANCHDACNGCTGPAASDCTACATGFWNDAGTCSAATACGSDEYESAAPTQEADRQCADCNAACSGCSGAGADACEVCAGGYWSNTGTCTDVSTCGDDEYESAAPTTTSDRECAACDEACDGCSGSGASACSACASGYVHDGSSCQAATPPSISAVAASDLFIRENVDALSQAPFDAAAVELGSGGSQIVKLRVTFAGYQGADAVSLDGGGTDQGVHVDVAASTSTALEIVPTGLNSVDVAAWTAALRLVTLTIDDDFSVSTGRIVRAYAIDADGRVSTPASRGVAIYASGIAACDAGSGWDDYVAGGCIKYDNIDDTKAAADTYCANLGAALPSVHSTAAFNQIEGYLAEGSDRVWVGTNDNPPWVRSDGVAAADGDFWADGEPKSLDEPSFREYQCAVVVADSGQLASVECDSNRTPLCNDGAGGFTVLSTTRVFTSASSACAEGLARIEDAGDLSDAAAACTSATCWVERSRPMAWADGSEWDYTDNLSAGDEYAGTCLTIRGSGIFRATACDDTRAAVCVHSLAPSVTDTSAATHVEYGTESLTVRGTGFGADTVVWLAAASGTIAESPISVSVVSDTELTVVVAPLSSDLDSQMITAVVASGGVHSGDPVGIAYVINPSKSSSSRLRRLVAGDDAEDAEDETLPPLPVWDFNGSLFFCFQLITTIGYGSQAPTLLSSKMFLITYSLLGIAAAGFLLDTMGRVVLLAVTAVYKKFTKRDMNTEAEVEVFFVLAFLLVLLMGLVISALEWGERGTEPWTVFEGIYFACITLSTIGLGDYVPSTLTSRTFTGLFSCVGLGVIASLFTAMAALAEERAAALRLLKDSLPKDEFERRVSMLRRRPCGCCRRSARAYAASNGPPSGSIDGLADEKLDPESAKVVDDDINTSSKRHHHADDLWGVAAREAVDYARSRRGDSVETLVPRAMLSFVAFFVILMLGAIVFNAYEAEPERVREVEYATWQDMVSQLQEHQEVLDDFDQQLQDMLDSANPNAAERAASLRARLAQQSEGGDEAPTEGGSAADAVDAENAPLAQWDWAGGSFFALTIVSTIGYGNYSVTTTAGQVFTIFYGLAGIVLAAVVFDSVSRFILGVATAVHVRVTRRPTVSRNEELAIALSLVIFLLLSGATCFMAFADESGENWWNHLYFVFVSLSTIGLGDVVPATRVGVVFLGIYAYLALGLFGFTLNALGDHVERANKKGSAAVSSAAKKLGFSVRSVTRRKLPTMVKPSGAATVKVQPAPPPKGSARVVVEETEGPGSVG
mmetsp:Transcript_22124/g.77524  ORF Transcript_22124/g.77524 Transcript_22124/m.77524 type:complete len:2118 (-) Transcript_22124:13-6366(-)